MSTAAAAAGCFATIECRWEGPSSRPARGPGMAAAPPRMLAQSALLGSLSLVPPRALPGLLLHFPHQQHTHTHTRQAHMFHPLRTLIALPSPPTHPPPTPTPPTHTHFSKLREEEDFLWERQVWSYFLQAALGVQYLHHNHVLHRQGGRVASCRVVDVGHQRG